MIHNFPDGMATLGGALKSIELGIVLAKVIALHNIRKVLAQLNKLYLNIIVQKSY